MKKAMDLLLQYAEPDYADFAASLAPTVERGSFLGVRVPNLRKIAKQLDTKDRECFLGELPHQYYEENLLHSVLISELKNQCEIFERLETFLPYVDNWAVCDTLRPKVFSKKKEGLLGYIDKWIASGQTYKIRFAVDMLMTYFLDDGFELSQATKVAGIVSDEYYVNMMAGWYFATALAKRWDDIIPFIEGRKLTDEVYRKSIQKSIESYRISPVQKDYLKSLRGERIAPWKSTLCYIEHDGKFLMLYRNRKKNDMNAGKWIGVGGKIEPGESPDEGMRREIREETGISEVTLRRVGTVFFHQGTNHEIMYLYKGFLPDDFREAEATDFDCNEGELKWIAINEIMGLSLWEGDRIFLQRMLESNETFNLHLYYEGDRLVKSSFL